MYQMFQIITLVCALLTQCMITVQPFSLQDLLTKRLAFNTEPLSYVIRLENVDTDFPTFKSKRNILEGIETEKESLLAELVEQIDSSSSAAKRPNQTVENSSTKRRVARNNLINPPMPGPKDLHLKANLRYHHQQRHPNGSVSGSYAQMDPTGQLKVTHYVNDGSGFKEFLEGGDTNGRNIDPYQNSPSGKIDVVTNSNNGILPADVGGLHSQSRRGITPLDGNGVNVNFIPNMAAPYNTPPLESINGSPIVHSAHGSVNQFAPKSPLFDKYYRPSPEEVQRTYEYHRMRSVFDPNQYRPTDMTSIPDIPRDKQPELRSVYSEYQVPYQVRYQDDASNGGGAGGYLPYNSLPREDNRLNVPYAPPLVPLGSPGISVPQSQDLYPPLAPVTQSAYPQTLPPQAPVYLQSYEGQTFVPASTYSGPYVPNTATFNQPYPTNIPIYNGPLPQNVATYTHPPPEGVPVYHQPSQPAYAQHPQQSVYYASASNPQPTASHKS